MLKPQDILVALKLLVLGDEAPGQSFSSLAESLGLSGSETHAAVNRGVRCRLLSAVAGVDPLGRRSGLPTPSVGHLLRFVEFGLSYVFPADRGPVVTGMPTGVGAAPLRDEFITGASELLPVWPWSEGITRGVSLRPIYRSCPLAAANDSRLHRLLALVDAIRDDGARQRQVAIRLFRDDVHALVSSDHRLAAAP